MDFDSLEMEVKTKRMLTTMLINLESKLPHLMRLLLDCQIEVQSHRELLNDM